MLSLFGRAKVRAGTRITIVRKDRLRRRLGLPLGVAGPIGDLLAANEASRRHRWLIGLSAGALDTDVTQLSPEQNNPLFREAASRVFDGREINPQYWGVREQRPLVLHEFRDVMIASEGNDLAIFRGTMVDDRSVGIVTQIRRIDPERVTRLETVALCDDHFLPGNPCHVLVDRMTRAVTFRRLGIAESDISFTFADSKFGPYARDKIVPAARTLQAGMVYRVGRLLVLSTTFQPHHGHPFWYGDAANLDAILTPLLADIPSGGRRKLYLARTDAKRRPLVNEPQLMTRLEAAGFHSVVMGGLSPHEQLSLCRSASVIVAPHGAAVMNAVAAEPGTRVVELFNPEIGSAVYAIASYLRGHDYHALFGTPVRAEGAPDDAWRIDVDAVLDAALG